MEEPRRGGRKMWQTGTKGAGLSNIVYVHVCVSVSPTSVYAVYSVRLWGVLLGLLSQAALGFSAGYEGWSPGEKMK